MDISVQNNKNNKSWILVYGTTFSFRSYEHSFVIFSNIG